MAERGDTSMRESKGTARGGGVSWWRRLKLWPMGSSASAALGGYPALARRSGASPEALALAAGPTTPSDLYLTKRYETVYVRIGGRAHTMCCLLV